MAVYVNGVVQGSGGGGGGGGGADVRGPTFIVGSAAEGDIIDNVTHLDSGNGDALRAALAAAAAAGGRVHVRRGRYPLVNGTTHTIVPGQVQLDGEGEQTELVLPSSGQMLSLLLQGGARVDNCSIRMVINPTGPIDDGAGNRFIELQGGASLNRCFIEVLATAPTVGNYPFFWSVIRLASPLATVRQCRLNGYSSAALGAGSESIGIMGVGGYCRIIDCVLGDTGSDRWDCAIEIGEGDQNIVDGCTIVRSRTYGVRIIAVFDMFGTMVENCNIRPTGGDGIGTMFVGDSTVRGVILNGNLIQASGGANGINLASVSGTRQLADVTVMGNILRGAGGGTGLRIAESGGGVNTNVIEAGNNASGFGTDRDVAATGGLEQAINFP